MNISACMHARTVVGARIATLPAKGVCMSKCMQIYI